MRRDRDLDDLLRAWPYDPDPGEIQAREVRARDGRSLLQVRVELGVLQMEAEGRPDGMQPHGYPTYLDYLQHSAARRPGWTMQAEHCAAADREFVQFFHRRVTWLALQRYGPALRDATHTLSLMDFVAEHGINPEYISHHERYRGLVLFHRTQAAAALALERQRPEEAIDALREGMELLTTHQARWGDSQPPATEPDEMPGLGSMPGSFSGALNEAFLDQLREIEAEIRRTFDVGKTLREQLDEAVAREDYEKAARLRDQIRARGD